MSPTSRRWGGLDPDGYELSRIRPDESLFEAWDGNAGAFADQMDEATKELFRGDIVELVLNVAEAAGGTLGVGRISRAERDTVASNSA